MAVLLALSLCISTVPLAEIILTTFIFCFFSSLFFFHKNNKYKESTRNPTPIPAPAAARIIVRSLLFPPSLGSPPAGDVSPGDVVGEERMDGMLVGELTGDGEGDMVGELMGELEGESKGEFEGELVGDW